MSSAPASGATATAKNTSKDNASAPSKDPKPAAVLEEDDEFEDFPVESRYLRFECYSAVEELSG
jgi:hypothetical protein